MKKTILLFAIIFSLFSCSKDDEPASTPIVEENPIEKFLTDNNLKESVNLSVNNSMSYELGYSFVPLKDGKINSITLNLPDNNNNILISLWDYNGHSKLFEKTVNYSSSYNTQLFKIDSYPLIKNKRYMISMYTNDYYVYYRNNLSMPTFPFTVNNINMYKSVSSLNSGHVFPEDENNFNYYGILGFNFETIN